MALRMINLHTVNTFEWSKDPDKGTDNATKFDYRALDAYEQAFLQDRISTIESMPTLTDGMSSEEIMSKVKTRTEVHKVAIDAVRLACTGFTNLEKPDGTEQGWDVENVNIAGKTKPLVKQDIVRALPVALLLEFYMDIVAKTNVDASTEKNSVQG